MKSNIIKTCVLVAPVILASCSSFYGNREVAQVKAELPYGVVRSAPLNSQTIYYVGLDNLRIRTAGEDKAKSAGVLNLGDRVKVINPNIISAQNYVEISIVKAVNDNVKQSSKYFINQDFLSEKKVDYKNVSTKYFVVVNVASETLRLYERVCSDNSCPHKMLLETEVVVGENKVQSTTEKGKGRSTLGSYRVSEWIKFYDDGSGMHPAWYIDDTIEDKNGNEVKIPIPPYNSPLSWFKGFKGKKYMTADTPSGAMRGAFGWYTAKVVPNGWGQWTHGTIGWGEDKDMAISRTKGFFVNMISNPRSSGCTRNNNEAIAYIRHMISIGTPIVKIYAKEDVSDPLLQKYEKDNTTNWDYILTKDTKFHTIDREEVLRALNLSGEEVDAFWEKKRKDQMLTAEDAGFASKALDKIIEVGSYEVDSHPDAFPWKNGRSGKTRTGNVYGLKPENVRGTFYVDSGMLENYIPPIEKNLKGSKKSQILEFYGFTDEETPPFMDIRNIKK